MIYANNWNLPIPKDQKNSIELQNKDLSHNNTGTGWDAFISKDKKEINSISSEQNLDLEDSKNIDKIKSVLAKIYIEKNQLEFNNEDIIKLLDSISKTFDLDDVYDPKGEIPFPNDKQPSLFDDIDFGWNNPSEDEPF
jgi:hypothetical protein